LQCGILIVPTVRNVQKYTNVALPQPVAGVQKIPAPKPQNIASITFFSEKRDEINYLVVVISF